MDELEEWALIRDFPSYSISSLGRVRNDKSGALMAMLRNQWGIVNVGLTKEHHQYKRAVAPLVYTLNPPALFSTHSPAKARVSFAYRAFITFTLMYGFGMPGMVDPGTTSPPHHSATSDMFSSVTWTASTWKGLREYLTVSII